MERVHELVTLPGKKSRLTITPLRITVKVSREHQVLESELVQAAQKIAEDITQVRTLRGCFDVKHKVVTLRTNPRHVAAYLEMTYRFDGTLAKEAS